MLHFLQSQTFGCVLTRILLGFSGVPSKPTCWALAVFAGLFTMAKVSHNSWMREAVMLVTGRCAAADKNRLRRGGYLSQQLSIFAEQLSNLAQPALDSSQN
jgi:hypothetical protein